MVKPGHTLCGLAFFVLLTFCLGACDSCHTPGLTEPLLRIDGQLVSDAGPRELPLEFSSETQENATPKESPSADDLDVGDDTRDVIGDAGAGRWENGPITPWDGPSLEGGIPDGHVWETRGRGFVQRVVSFQPAKGAGHGHSGFPAKIKGPPQGLGDAKGSLHAVSLGCGGSIILEFSAPLIGNGPGPDFVIFENAFFPGGGKETFAEPAQVSVSIDGKKWFPFPCQPDQTSWPHPQCAGIKAVYANPSNQIDPNDPATAGGDAFDLADVKLPFARFVKIEDRSRLSPDASLWCGAYNAGFDLDAVGVIWGFTPR